ncbi:glycosyltransferase [Rudanella paleaurantiibacter]|uniref:Glycosyltransferase n=1 Tax=Rudanella paleaurantiibacter TaxID=2614655 RepID=A0A7J5U502_9BACT|nr:glycosyltransferase family A protein [Rudanella paleaurantiibacter]KAB7732667.1 glycosyltransferase [Rudanella paleaurantiibacter]
MTVSPTVSVIIPAYNAGRYVVECLESVLTQTRLPTEVIVINDGSTDDTLEWLLPFADRVWLHSRENRGVCQTLNEAIGYASGNLIAFIDADDRWEPHKLARQLEYMAQNPALDACFSYIKQFVSPDLPAPVRASIACPAEAQPGWSKITLLIRRDAFARTGLFDPAYHTGDFIEWFTRAKHVGLCYAMLPDVLAHRRLHRNGLASQTQHQHEFAQILKAHLERQKTKAPQQEP